MASYQTFLQNGIDLDWTVWRQFELTCNSSAFCEVNGSKAENLGVEYIKKGVHNAPWATTASELWLNKNSAAVHHHDHPIARVHHRGPQIRHSDPVFFRPRFLHTGVGETVT